MSEDSKPSTIGPVGAQVVANIEQLRHVRGLSFAGLSERLAGVGQSIHANVLHRLSQGKRRVDADDLMALAVALRVPPTALLLPRDAARDDLVPLTPKVSVPAWVAWEWADGRTYLPEGEVTDRFEIDPAAAADFVTNGRPALARRRNQAAVRETEILITRLLGYLNGKESADRVRRQLERVHLEVDDLIGLQQWVDKDRWADPE